MANTNSFRLLGGIFAIIAITFVDQSLAITCMDDWTECSGAMGPQSTCSSDSCAVSLVPVENCGSFVLRTCSVDHECLRSLSDTKRDFFNIKRVGPNSLVYDYCCTGADYCNNQTEAQLITKLCAWMRKNLAGNELAHHEVRRLCGADAMAALANHQAPPVAPPAAPSKFAAFKSMTKQEKPRQIKPAERPMKCACDVDVPGRFLQCNLPSESAIFGYTDVEDVMPYCNSKDASCSVFLTLDVNADQNGTAEIVRGCVDRDLPVSQCDNAGPGGAFVEITTQQSSMGPFIYEYCCNRDSFCNVVTIDDLVRKVCSWLKQRRPRPSAALTASTPPPLRRTTSKTGGTRMRQLNQREIRKNSLIYRTFCQN